MSLNSWRLNIFLSRYLAMSHTSVNTYLLGYPECLLKWQACFGLWVPCPAQRTMLGFTFLFASPLLHWSQVCSLTKHHIGDFLWLVIPSVLPCSRRLEKSLYLFDCLNYQSLIGYLLRIKNTFLMNELQLEFVLFFFMRDDLTKWNPNKIHLSGLKLNCWPKRTATAGETVNPVFCFAAT